MVTIETHPDPRTRIEPELEWVIAVLGSTFEALVEAAGLEPLIAVDVVISSDFDAAVRSYADTAGSDEALGRFHSNRLGGVVRGKTLARGAGYRDPVVILDASTVHTSTQEAFAESIFIIAHEFVHVLVGRARARFGTTLERSGLPRVAAQWITRYTLDEYLADVIADRVLSQFGTVTTSEGQTLPLSSRMVAPYSEVFIDAASSGLGGLIDTIHSYRLGHLDIDELWASVQTTTNDFLITLAHAQAELDPLASDGDVHPVTGKAGFGPLHTCWAELHKLFRSVSPLAAADFGETEKEVLCSGSESIVEFWNQIGLTFTPLADTFHIAVAHPDRTWPSSGPLTLHRP